MSSGTDDHTVSHVFLLRIWLDGGWRGRLQDLLSGEARSFAGWVELLAALRAALPGTEGAREAKEAGEQEDTRFI